MQLNRLKNKLGRLATSVVCFAVLRDDSLSMFLGEKNAGKLVHYLHRMVAAHVEIGAALKRVRDLGACCALCERNVDWCADPRPRLSKRP